jgi:hypothetical protein
MREGNKSGRSQGAKERWWHLGGGLRAEGRDAFEVTRDNMPGWKSLYHLYLVPVLR